MNVTKNFCVGFSIKIEDIHEPHLIPEKAVADDIVSIVEAKKIGFKWKTPVARHLEAR